MPYNYVNLSPQILCSAPLTFFATHKEISSSLHVQAATSELAKCVACCSRVGHAHNVCAEVCLHHHSWLGGWEAFCLRFVFRL